MPKNFKAFFEKRGFKVGKTWINQSGTVYMRVSDPAGALRIISSIPDGTNMVFLPLSRLDRFKNFFRRR